MRAEEQQLSASPCPIRDMVYHETQNQGGGGDVAQQPERPVAEGRLETAHL